MGSNVIVFNRGPPRFDGERRFGGDRDGYRGGPRGPGGDFGDKGGAPADYRVELQIPLNSRFPCGALTGYFPFLSFYIPCFLTISYFCF